MNYQEAIDWIHSREKFKVKPGLKRMTWMMERLEHPEDKFKAIHIAGTNGKGSTVSFLRHILQEQGYSIGTFTSPYIEKFNERISVNGHPVPDEAIARLVLRIKPLAEELSKTPMGEPTEFEIITAMAMIYFSEEKLDYVLIETGLGGRYDSTNIIQPLVSVITNIGLDHMNILGSTVEEIAGEKAGIIKEDVPVVTAVKQQAAWRVIQRYAEELNASVYRMGEQFEVQHVRSTFEGEVFHFSNQEYKSEEMLSHMKGNHQVENAGVAIQAVELLRKRGAAIDRSTYGKGIAQTVWPARFENIRHYPLTIIDGAHNEAGTRALIETLKRHYPDKKVVLVYAALEDKPVSKMLHQLSEVIETAYMTTFDFPRALSAEDLADLSPITNTQPLNSYKEALVKASKSVNKNDVLLITGSLYFISQVRKYFETQ